MTKFSIIIPLYNKSHEIQRTLESIKHQNYRNFELIIIDDGSTDDGAEKAKEYLDQISCDGEKIIIKKENGGVSSARNKGISEASGIYIVFLDADDILLPNHLSTLNDITSQFKNNIVFSTEYFRIEEYKNNNFNQNNIYTQIIKNPFLEFSKNLALLNSSTTCVRRDALNGKYLFPENCKRGEDIYLWILLINEFGIVHTNKKTVVIDSGASNRSAYKPLNHIPEYFTLICTLLEANNIRKENISGLKNFYFKSAMATAGFAAINKNKKISNQFILQTISQKWYIFSFAFLLIHIFPSTLLHIIREIKIRVY